MLPNNREAQYVVSSLQRIGIRDVQLFYDSQVKLWAVCQVKQVPTTILTMDNASGTKIEPSILWWCRDSEGEYRAPNDQDISDMVATGQRAQIAWHKGGDWLDDQMLSEEKTKQEKRDAKQKERIKYMARHTNLREHIRREMG